LGRKNTFSIFAIVGVTALAMGIFIFLFWNSEFLFGSGSTVATNFIQLFPGILVFAVGMIVVMLTKGIWNVPAMLLTGIGLCVLLGSMDKIGAISAIMLGGLTMNEIYTWVIVLSGLFGAVLAAVTVKR
jgi:hypothetical protein